MIPVGNRIAVQRDAMQGERKLESGLFVPETAERKPQLATVMFVGPGLRTTEGKIVPTQCKPGDRVILGQYAGADVIVADKTYTILRDDEVLAITDRSAGN